MIRAEIKTIVRLSGYRTPPQRAIVQTFHRTDSCCMMPMSEYSKPTQILRYISLYSWHTKIYQLMCLPMFFSKLKKNYVLRKLYQTN